MTSNEKKVEQHESKVGDHQQVAGAQITKSEDSAIKQRQDLIDASKAFRFTKGDNAFTLEMPNGEKVKDKRPQQKDAADVKFTLEEMIASVPISDDNVPHAAKAESLKEAPSVGERGDLGHAALEATRKALQFAIHKYGAKYFLLDYTDPGSHQHKHYDVQSLTWLDDAGHRTGPPPPEAYRPASADAKDEAAVFCRGAQSAFDILNQAAAEGGKPASMKETLVAAERGGMGNLENLPLRKESPEVDHTKPGAAVSRWGEVSDEFYDRL